ncbi:MAG: LD-carboxypeptidase [Gammaproteobacteria bacterium]|nr:MAG: LD-carboxypeptidase [Gammaproteobacteria bacterium]
MSLKQKINQKQSIKASYTKDDETCNNITTVNRRTFLKGLGLGVGSIGAGVSLASRAELVGYSSKNDGFAYNRNFDFNATNSDDQNGYQEFYQPVQTCNAALIDTRLFSSSNTSSGMYERNNLAIKRLTCAGFHVQNPEILNRQYYRFGGSDKERANDFEYIANGRVDAPKLLLGVRGGYGAMRILDKVNWAKLGSVLKERGTIVGGFSDVTAIQCALLAKGGMGSSNLPMAYSEFGKYMPDPISCAGFVKAVTDKNLVISTDSSDKTSYKLPTILSKRPNQRISGKIWGGNLSVLSAIAGSTYMPNPSGGIVFIEEVGEQPYRLERMLYDLHLAGVFKNQQAIVFGAMARSGSDGYDPNYDVAVVINELYKVTGLPIYSGVGFGHISEKQSFPMGCDCTIMTNGSGFDLKFANYPTIDADLIYEPALSAYLDVQTIS